jgi:hypothetical protein
VRPITANLDAPLAAPPGKPLAPSGRGVDDAPASLTAAGIGGRATQPVCSPQMRPPAANRICCAREPGRDHACRPLTGVSQHSSVSTVKSSGLADRPGCSARWPCPTTIAGSAGHFDQSGRPPATGGDRRRHDGQAGHQSQTRHLRRRFRLHVGWHNSRSCRVPSFHARRRLGSTNSRWSTSSPGTILEAGFYQRCVTAVAISNDEVTVAASGGDGDVSLLDLLSMADKNPARRTKRPKQLVRTIVLTRRSPSAVFGHSGCRRGGR